jgi:predicted ribosome quality control (RQC) complex YloA/Tae2 family protein
MKQRVSSLDLKILISELENSIKGYRLQNIYNLVANNRSFLLKFSIPDSKYNVVIESGFKVYMTDFQRPTQPEPSNFASKLRKHLKTKRLTNIKQIGDDRIAVLEFSDGFYYLVLEFFSAGNIILLDADLKILTIFRFVDTNGKVQEGQYDVGSTYNMFDKSLFEESNKTSHNEVYDEKQILKWIEDTKQTEREKKKVLSIEKLCFQHASYLSSDLIHISILKNFIKPTTSCLELLENNELLQTTVKSINDAQNRYKDLLSTPVGEIEGYILSQKNSLFKEDQEPSPDNLEYVYHEFHPYEPIHKIKENIKVESIKGYNKTVDKFFTTIEMSKVSISRQIQQANIEKRLQFVKDEHAKKLQALDDIQELNYKKGYLINVYNEQIEQCKESVQTLIDQKMDWKNIEKLIKVEQSRGNEIAKMIKSLNLAKNEITITLVDIDDNEELENSNDDNLTDDSDWSSDDSDSEEEEEESEKSASNKGKEINTVDVTIDITQSAFANSSRYFDAKKSAKEKQEKTSKSAAFAIRSSEQKIQHDLKKIQKDAKQNVEFKQLRPKFWFEKFFWFISNEGYLCLAGRDDSQIDSIYYRYFDNETDLFVSNDLENALKVFIKNPYKNKDVPPTTYMQAGIFSLSSTKAWENKMVVSPWYVSGKNISKKDFDGTILPSGMLNVAKERNYLPPCQMVMGAGLLFVSDDETFTKYKTNKEAKDKELELICADKSEGHVHKIQELKTMLEKLQEKEKNMKVFEEASKQEEVNEDVDEESGNEEDIVVPVTPNQQTLSKIRGKKGKLKKIKEKYGQQDEEERKLRMAVLGNLKQVEQNNEDVKNNAQDKAINERMSIAAKKQRKRQTQINQITKLIDELENKNDATEETDEQTMVYAKMVNDVDNYHLKISGLLSSPNKTDKITDCIPVFAPWSALNKFAYKVKLQPGNLKKGKTVSDIIEVFKKRTKDLQEENSDWYDNNNLIELINQQDFLMSLTASKFKVGSGGDKSKGNNNKSGSSKAKNGTKNKGKKK